MTSLECKQNNPPIPVSIITGFLGSGKTTLLNELIQHPDMDKVAVLINEFGEVGLDHQLVETISEDIILLQSGCICCQIKDDLVTTLTDLFDRRESGEIEPFSRVLIETTGVADPVPVIQVLISEPTLSRRFRLDITMTLVDCVFGHSQLAKHAEALKQVALADRLILTKTDLVDTAAITALQKQIKQINPSAFITTAVNGVIHPQVLFNRRFADRSKEEQQRSVEKWLNKDAHIASGQHLDGVSSICVSLDEPIDWECFSEWLDSLVFSRAENILRIKGILNIAGKEQPLVIQGVQHMFYAPTTLKKWPTADRQSHIVFITYQFNPRAIKTSLEKFLGLGSATPVNIEEEIVNAR